MTEQELKEIIKNAKKELTLLRAAVRSETSSIIPIENRTGFFNIINPRDIYLKKRQNDCVTTYVVDKFIILPDEHARIVGHELKLNIPDEYPYHIYENTIDIKCLKETTDQAFADSIQSELIKVIYSMPNTMGKYIVYMVISNAVYLVQINKKQN